MSTARLSTLWVRELRSSQSQCLQRQLNQRAYLSSTTSAPICGGSGSCNVTGKSRLASSTSSPARSYSQGSAISRLAKSALSPGASAETYIAYGMTQKLFQACSSQADYQVPQASQKGVAVPTTESGEHLGTSESWWYKVRLRALPNRESFQTYSRHLIDHFSHNAEHRMDDLHDIGSRSIRNKYLKDLFIQWRGIIAAYDEGLIKGDAVLGAAVWRNLWKAEATGPDGSELDWSKVAWVVAYMRRVTAQLARMDEADIVMELSGASGQESKIFGFSELDRKIVEASK
ncbi:CBP3-like protein [Penicillium subrubescens]|uniref:CBP3-like protein n=1 Tax=Penicillium subrubescens TaxID=1316194 RepID=A0A1Q5UEY9_9EURO|nr:CBP3-like protein [Penicillium subrubescens]